MDIEFEHKSDEKIEPYEKNIWDIVNNYNQFHVLIELAITHAYEYYYKKPYQEKSLCTEDDNALEYKGDYLYRPSHSILNALRRYIYYMYLRTNKTFLDKYHHFEEEHIFMELLLIFYTTGRKSEAGSSNKKEYEKYRINSKEAFKKFLEQEKELIITYLSTNGIKHFDEELYLSAMETVSVNSKKKAKSMKDLLVDCLRLCHELDLPRCIPEFDASLNIANYFSEDQGELDGLVKFCIKCIKQTGDKCVYLGSQLVAYNLETFFKLTKDPIKGLKVLNEILLRTLLEEHYVIEKITQQQVKSLYDESMDANLAGKDDKKTLCKFLKKNGIQYSVYNNSVYIYKPHINKFKQLLEDRQAKFGAKLLSANDNNKQEEQENKEILKAEELIKDVVDPLLEGWIYKKSEFDFNDGDNDFDEDEWQQIDGNNHTDYHSN